VSDHTAPHEQQLLANRLSGWTNVPVANLLGSDYPPAPTPVHIACFERAGGERNGWRRITGAERTIPIVPGQRNAWHTLRDADGTYHNLPAGSVCYFCGGLI
jgi:hypothetical protein